MDTSEATRIVFSRIQALDPEHAAKIMGLLLIQGNGDKEMIRLAFGPESLLHSLIIRARKDLGLLLPPSTNPSPPPFLLSRQNSRGPNSTSSLAPSPPFSMADDGDGGDEYPGYGWDQRSCFSPDGFGWKPCLYYARGFCKNGNSCRFLHAPPTDDVAAAAAAVEQQCQELTLMRSKSQRLNLMLQQQNESQRAAAMAALMLDSESHKFMGRPRMDLGDFAGMVSPVSRQIYLTFPSDSTFREEDVSNYFSIYGPVQDVRIPYQQKRMFGFVTFVYPETVKLILAKGNPHFVCDARVLVKPYKEKGKVPDKKQQFGERIDFSGCTTLTGLDSRDPYDLQQLASARMLYGGIGHDVLLRRKMEEQQTAGELQKAIEMQGRRFTGLQLLDIKNRNLGSPTAPMLSPLATPASITFSASVFSDARSSNGSQDEGGAVEDKSLSPAFAAAADKQQTAVNSEERAATETTPNEDLSYQESDEHNLPDSPFASPTRSSLVNDSFSLGSEESNGHFIASTNMASCKSSCFLQLPRFSSGHGAVGL